MLKREYIQFFSSLSSLLSDVSNKSQGSVYLVQKQLPASADTSSPVLKEEGQSSLESQPVPSILIRATDGRTGNSNPKNNTSSESKKNTPTSKIKISTVVASTQLETFYTRYAEICKAGMTGMKKRDRSAKKKGKAKAKGPTKVTKA